jgi:hypothetical protein
MDRSYPMSRVLFQSRSPTGAALPLHVRSALCADFAAANVGQEGSVCLLLVEEPELVVVMRHVANDAGDKVIRHFVDTGGRGLCPEKPPPAHRIAWATSELPTITRTIVDHNPRAGVTLLVWFGDVVGDHESVWMASSMALNDNLIFFRDYLGSRP